MIGRRTLIGLAAAGAVTTVSAILAHALRRTPVTAAQAQPAMPDLIRWFNLAGRIEIRTADTSFSIERTDQGWVVVPKGRYPARGGLPRQVLLALSELELVEPRTARPDFYGRIGVEGADAPGSRSLDVVVVSSGGAVLGHLIIGKRRQIDVGALPGTYVRRSGDDQAWLAAGRLEIPDHPAEWLERRLVELPTDRVRDVVVAIPGRPALSMRRDDPSAPFALADPPPEDRRVDRPNRLLAAAGALQGLDLLDVRADSGVTMAFDGRQASYTTFDGLLVAARAVIDPQALGETWVRLDATMIPPADDAVREEVAHLQGRFSGRIFRLALRDLGRVFAGIEDVTVPRLPQR